MSTLKTTLQKNCFCKLEIVPFPFTCTLLYDNGEIVTLYDGESILKLASQNKSSLCAIRKETRLTLRAMANSMNIKIHFPYKEGRFEPVEIRKGKIQDIDMDLEFEEGSLIIQAVDGSQDVFSKPGFSVSMKYNDGFGRCEYKSREYIVKDRQTSISLEDLGIDKDFSPIEDEEQCLVTSGTVVGDADIGTLEYNVKNEIYLQRKEMYDSGKAEEKVLPTNFWWQVYNVPGMTRAELINFLQDADSKSNGVFQIYEKNLEAFDYIYARMGHLQGNPAAEMWYIFWHDVWIHNRHLLSLRRLKKKLNPRNPSAICYHVVERTELEKILNKAKVLNRKRESDNLFSPGMLDLLYFRLSKLTEWSEISASTSSRKTKGEILHMNTIQTRNANEKLQPMLKRAKERGHDVAGNAAKSVLRRNILAGTTYIVVCYILLNGPCLVSQNFCGGINLSNTIVGISLMIVFFVLVIVALRFWGQLANTIERCHCQKSSKYKSAKVQPINKVRGESPKGRDPLVERGRRKKAD